MVRLGHVREVLTTEVSFIGSDGENVVLMQAPLQFTPPHSPAAQFVQVSALSHQNIATPKCAAAGHTPRHRNLRDGVKVEAPCLDIGHAEVWASDYIASNIALCVDRQAVLQAGHITEAHQLVPVREPERTGAEN